MSNSKLEGALFGAILAIGDKNLAYPIMSIQDYPHTCDRYLMMPKRRGGVGRQGHLETPTEPQVRVGVHQPTRSDWLHRR